MRAMDFMTTLRLWCNPILFLSCKQTISFYLYVCVCINKLAYRVFCRAHGNRCIFGEPAKTPLGRRRKKLRQFMYYIELCTRGRRFQGRIGSFEYC